MGDSNVLGFRPSSGVKFCADSVRRRQRAETAGEGGRDGWTQAAATATAQTATAQTADGGDSTDGGDGGDGGRAAATPAEYQTTPLCSTRLPPGRVGR